MAPPSNRVLRVLTRSAHSDGISADFLIIVTFGRPSLLEHDPRRRHRIADLLAVGAGKWSGRVERFHDEGQVAARQ